MKKIFILSILLLIGLNANNYQDAQNGNPQSQYKLGLHYKNAQNKNLRESFRWMHKSALKGYTPAQYEFGLMFHYGIGVRQNFELARLWFRRASRNGEPRAKSILYRFYAGKKVGGNDGKHRQYYTQNFRTIRR